MSDKSILRPEKIKIDVQKLKVEFKKQIGEPMNKRMVFSGIFGSGKTTFLKEFFQENTEYLPLHIYPVNYSVASNEDIFELIKYDIFYKLLDYEPNLEKIDVSNFEALTFLDDDDIINIITPFIKSLCQIDKRVSGVIESLESLKKALLKKKKELVVDQGKSINSFYQSFKSKKGNIYEHDFYTELLNILVNDIENKNGSDGTQRKLVLIIDDLDRIDPEHIFRILNVFAAHFDIESDRNKFGLSKVIISCDIENIRKMFFHRYGEGVDFNGYMNKFYSTKIFKLDNAINIINSLDRILKSIKTENTYKHLNALDNPRKLSSIFLNAILKILIGEGRIPMRDLTRYDSENLPIALYQIYLEKPIYNFQVVMMTVIEYLATLFGDSIQLTEVFKTVKLTPLKLYLVLSRTNDTDLFLRFIGDIMLINNSRLTRFKSIGEISVIINSDTFLYSSTVSNLDGYSELYSGKLTGYNTLRFELGSRNTDDLNDFLNNDELNLTPMLINAIKFYSLAPRIVPDTE